MEIDDQQAAMRDLIRAMMEATGLDPTSLARSAGVAPSTLTRFLNQPVKHLLTARTLAKLSKVSGVPVPVGSPLIGPNERELLASFRSTDDEGRTMILRFARSLRRDSETQPGPAQAVPPQGPEPPRPFVVGGRVKENRAKGCLTKIVPLRAVVPT